MGRLKDLVDKGVRLIVVQEPDGSQEAPGSEPDPEMEAESRPASPARLRTKTVEAPAGTFEGEGPKPVVRSQVPANVEGWAPVYEEAGVALPVHGYGVDKVADMLQSKRLASLGREVKASAVLAALEAAQVSIRDVVQDAVVRDRALDAFEAAKQKELGELQARNAARIESLQNDIQALLQKINAEVESLKKESEQAHATFAALQQRKQQEEQRLFEAVAHFIEGAENPVTTTGRGGSKPTPPRTQE